MDPAAIYHAFTPKKRLSALEIGGAILVFVDLLRRHPGPELLEAIVVEQECGELLQVMTDTDDEVEARSILADLLRLWDQCGASAERYIIRYPKNSSPVSEKS